MVSSRARDVGRAWFTAMLTAALAACGGGGGSGGDTDVVPAGAPVIVFQPASTRVEEGRQAQFEVSASGTAPLVYQWQRDGLDIAGATDERYTTPATTAADDGAVFRVVVSNPEGSATSAEAVLSVAAAPVEDALTLSGPGADAVGAGSRYVPASASASAQAPACNAGSCSSSLMLMWSRGPGDQLIVTLMSNGVAEPGATPGTQVNAIGITLSPGVLGAMGLNYACAGEGCSLPALGITLDRQARTLRFAGTRVPAWTGGPEVVLDGALRY